MLEIDLQWQQIHIILEEAQQKKINSLESLSALAIPTEFHSYNGLPHGFGLGIGTIAEGWLNDAVRFWQSQSGATAIHSAKANAGRSEAIYSLNGTRRKTILKGINIIVGKKFIK